MAAVEQDLWWYCALHGLVLDVLHEFVPDRSARILDAGCGTGGLMLRLREEGYTRLRGFDLSEEALAFCRTRGLAVKRESLVNLAQSHEAGATDAIVSNDTLYFLTAPEQSAFVQGCRRVLAPGGLLVLNLPALGAFRGIHDISVGIPARFSARDLRGLFDGSGFGIERQTYWPFFLSPIIYGARLKQRIRLRLRASVDVESDIGLPPRWLNEALYRITRWENRIFKRKPFGSSLFVVARKAGSEQAV